MTINLDELLQLGIYALLIILIIIFIIIGIRLIKTLDKVDLILSDTKNKMEKVDGVFTIVDKSSGYVLSASDKVVNKLKNLLKKGNDLDE